MKIKLLIVAILLGLAAGVQGQSTLTVGSTNDMSSYVPVFGVKANDIIHHTQIIYPADSITAMVDKFVTGIEFYLKAPAAEAFDSRWRIKMGTVEQTEFASAAALNNANFSVVYEGPLDATGATMAAAFSTPFDYRGGNLIVDITMVTAGTVATTCTFYGSLRAGSSLMNCAMVTGRYGFMPRATLTYTEPVIETRVAEHRDSVELCNGSTGSAYEWHRTLLRADNSEYDTVIYSVDLSHLMLVGDDTSFDVSVSMPRYLKGCADTEILNLKIYRPQKHYVYDTVCQGLDTYEGYGLSLDISGRGAGTTQYLTPESQWGRVYTAQCWDTTYLSLRINRSYKHARIVDICSSRLSKDENDSLYYVYMGHRITLPVMTVDSVILMDDTVKGLSVTGCDSTVILNVKVRPSESHDTLVMVNESQLPYTTMGVTFSYASTRTRVYYNQYNCDSVMVITLRLNPAYRDTTFVVGCGAYDWYVDGNYITTADHDTLASVWSTASDGMDSINYLRYTRGSINRADTTVEACESYWFKGIEYTRNAQALDTVPGIGMECDTQYLWHINIYYPQHRIDTASVCDSLLWNGDIYYTSTTAVYEYVANTCPSSDTLHLEVRYSSEGDTLVYAPQTYECYGNIYTASGQYTYVIPNRVGCDSTVTLQLYVTPHNTPLPQIYMFDGKVLLLNHYPYGDSTRVDYDSVRWEHDGVDMNFHGDEYHLPGYAAFRGCYKAWVKIEGVWFPTNEVCANYGIDGAEGTVEYRVRPNPTAEHSTLTIELEKSGTGSAEWQLYDIQGRRLSSAKLHMGSNRVECGVGKGVYLMRVVTDEGEAAVKKLIVN